MPTRAQAGDDEAVPEELRHRVLRPDVAIVREIPLLRQEAGRPHAHLAHVLKGGGEHPEEREDHQERAGDQHDIGNAIDRATAPDHACRRPTMNYA